MKEVFLYILMGLGAGIKLIPSVIASAKLYPLWEGILLCTIGGTVCVAILTYFGNSIYKWIDKKRGQNRKWASFKSRRRTYTFWKKYGLSGVAFITIIISPPISVAIAVAFREPPLRIIGYMFMSIAFWSCVLIPFVKWVW